MAQTIVAYTVSMFRIIPAPVRLGNRRRQTVFSKPTFTYKEVPDV
jgi:hypothetical protein